MLYKYVTYLRNKNVYLNNNQLRARLFRGVFWNLLSTIFARGFSMIAAIITARLLGMTGYGELGIINSTVMLFSTFAGLGLGVTCTRYIAELRLSDPIRVGRIIGLTTLVGAFSGTVMALVLFFSAPWLASATLGAPQLTPELRIAALLLIINTISGVQSGAFAGYEAFNNIARIGLLQGLSAFPINIVAVYVYGLRGAIISLVITSLIGLILNSMALRRCNIKSGIRTLFLSSWNESDILWKLAIPSMISSIMVGPVVWIGNALIVNTNRGYSQLGIFNAAGQWQLLVSFAPQIIGSVLLPLMVSQNAKDNRKLEVFNALSSWTLVSLAALPVIAIPEITGLFYGKDYISQTFYNTVALMMFVSCILSLLDGVARKLIVFNLMWWGFLNNFSWAIIFIVSVAFFKDFGAVGLASSYLISYILNTILFVPLFLKKNLVPSTIVISKQSLHIWLIIITHFCLTISRTPVNIRLGILPVSLILLIYSYKNIWIYQNR